jgi:hypothetical protein
MSERVGLGECDATARLLGLSRHQVALVIVGSGLLVDALVRSRLALEVAVALGVLAAAVPAGETSVGERIVLAFTYCLRGHFTSVALERGDVVSVDAGATVATRGYGLEHRGRLDLAGVDIERARALAATLDALATAPTGRHVSLHVHREGAEWATLLCLEHGRVPEGWRRDDDLVARVIGVGLADHLWLFERLGYVRTPGAVARVLRVRDLSAASTPLISGLQRSSWPVTISLHADVFGEASARRRAERTSHAATSNEAATTALGFRETSRARRRLARTLQREARVAEGRALMRLGVYVTVRATHLADLESAVSDVIARARETGVVLDRGWGRQIQWFRLQLPGGPNW